MTKYEELTQLINEALASRLSECVAWPYVRNALTYAVAYHCGKRIAGHRLACEIRNGPTPSDKHHAAHACGNRACVNPWHLDWKTAKENHADTLRHGTRMMGSRHYSTDFSEETIGEIRQKYVDGATQIELAKEYGVVKSTIGQIVRRDHWSAAPGPVGDPALSNERFRGSKHGMSKLGVPEVLEIRRAYEAGEMNQRELAEKYEVSSGAIHAIVRRKNWAWL